VGGGGGGGGEGVLPEKIGWWYVALFPKPLPDYVVFLTLFFVARGTG